jgi:hypothetical protein
MVQEGQGSQVTQNPTVTHATNHSEYPIVS